MEEGVIAQGDELQLCLNDQSTYFETATKSCLAQVFGETSFFPRKFETEKWCMLNDSAEDRKDEVEILKILRAKYAINNLQTFYMNQYTGMIRIPNQ